MVDQLGELSVVLDPDANAVRSSEARVISGASSAIPVLVVPTDEERAIAEATAAVVRAAIGRGAVSRGTVGRGNVGEHVSP